MSHPKIILHWLNASRSNRILWLLELLDVDYEVKVYHRGANFRAPKELEKIHPLGKSPVIEVVKEGQENEVVAETGRIIEFLIDEFDHSGKLAPLTDKGKGEVSYWLHYTEGTLQPFMTSFLVLDKAKEIAPWGAKTLVSVVTNKINDAYFGSEAIKNMEYLEGIAAKNKGGYFVDGKLTAADIALSFPVAEIVFGNQRYNLFPKAPTDLYPNLAKWSQLILEDPCYKKTHGIIQSNTKAKSSL